MATLAIAVLTGRRPHLLAETLDSFTRHHGDIWQQATRIALHNSGDQATTDVLERYDWHDTETSHDWLLSIAEATYRLDQLALGTGADLVLRLEDDWRAMPGAWWHDAVQLLGRAVQVRLRRASERVSSRCTVCKRRIEWRRIEQGWKSQDAHATWNPTLMRTDDLARAVGARSERAMARRLHPAPVAQLDPGVFAHIGDGELSLRRGGGRGAAARVLDRARG